MRNRTFFIFSKKSFSHILGNGTFLYFTKQLSDCFFAAFLSGTSFLCCCTASATDLRDLFLLSGVFCLILLPTFAKVPQVLRIWENFFYPETFFNLHSFPTFGTTCFYHGFPGSRHFFHEGCRASHWGSKHRPSPYLCLNHILFSKKYYLVGSIFVLRSYRTLYLPLPGFEITL